MAKKVILVDEIDTPLGEMEKLQSHREGKLHRAFSIFIFSPQGDWLLQKRAPGKYHSGGLWTNACCSHPKPGQQTILAAQRRLQEEMGFVCPLKEIFTFTYRKAFPNGLTEHEFDHVLIGTYDGPIRPDPVEVEAWQWLTQADLAAQVTTQPQKFTHWFIKIYRRVAETREKGAAG